jgi:predicted GNAT family acetyltransferase
LEGEQVAGAAYSSLVCSYGIEVSIYVGYRNKGIATALAAQMLLESLKQGRQPHWDAANPESFKPTRKLGYVFVESYDAWYHTGSISQGEAEQMLQE